MLFVKEDTKELNIKKVNNLIVFHDDLDLVFSKLRIKKSGGHGGHNGVKNIIKFFNNSSFIKEKSNVKKITLKKR